MTTDAVAVVVALTLLAGWYGRMLYQATQDVAAAKARLAGAMRAVWAARRIAVVVGLAVFVAIDFWFRKHGA